MRICVILIGLFICQLCGIARSGTENLTRDLFAESKIVWEKEFEGRVMDVQVGGRNVVVFEAFKYFDWKLKKTIRLREDWDYCVTYLDFEGNILWKKCFKEEYGKLAETSLETVKGRVSNISISRNGEYVVINQYWGFFPAFLASCYNAKGELVWEAKCEEPGLIISPYGSYALQTRQEVDGMRSDFIIVDNTGKELWREWRGDWTASWLDDSTVVLVIGSCYPTHCEAVLFDVKKLEARWSVNIGEELGEPEHCVINWSTPAVKVSNNGKFIAMAVDFFEKDEEGKVLGQRADRRKLIALDNSGKILWYSDDFVIMEHPEFKGGLGGLGGFSFTEDSDHLIAISVKTASTPLTVDLFDVFTGERRCRMSPKDGWFWMKSLGLKEIPSNVVSITPIYQEDIVKSVILLDKDGRKIQLIQLGD